MRRPRDTEQERPTILERTLTSGRLPWTEVCADYAGKIQSPLVTCALHGINPYTYIVNVLEWVSITQAADVADLTPIQWK